MPVVVSRVFLVIASLCACGQLLKVVSAGHGGESSEALSYLEHIYDVLQERMSSGHANLLDSSEGFANTAHCFPSERGTGGDLRFNLSDVKTTEAIISAMLVFKQPSMQYIGRLKVTSGNDQEPLSDTSLDSRSAHDGWMEVKIRVAPTLSHWNPASKEQYVLSIDFVTEEEDGDKPSVHDLNSMLVLFTLSNETLPGTKDTVQKSDSDKLEEPVTVEKRQAGYTGQEAEPCQVHEKFIPYSTLGWPDLTEIQVVKPANGITFNYCYGYCDLESTDTPHAVFLEFVRLRQNMTPPPAVPPLVCCPRV